MGYTYHNNTRHYWPDDGPAVMYMPSHDGYSLQDVLERAYQKWPGILPEDITISSEKIYIEWIFCNRYGQYDPIDYTNFIILTKNK